MKFLKVKYAGIGLLELMLSLAIIAILLIMAVRYYQSASQSQQMSSANDMINAVRSAMKNYHNDNPQVSSSIAFPDISTLVSGGYLPTSFGSGTTINPWNGNVIIASAGSCTAATSQNVQYSICLTQVPSTMCPQLASKIDSAADTSNGEGGDCTTTAGSLIATYNY